MSDVTTGSPKQHRHPYGYTPGRAIVLKESSGPRTYRFDKTVTYVTRNGKVLDEDVVRTRVKVSMPVRVHYVGTGDNMTVDRVILDEDLKPERPNLLCFPLCPDAVIRVYDAVGKRTSIKATSRSRE